MELSCCYDFNPAWRLPPSNAEITVCVKLPFGILIKKLVGTAAPKHVTEAVDRLIDAIDPRVCVAQVEIKVYLARVSAPEYRT